jgi:hypothetical protein
MFKSILVVVLACIASAFAIGCAPNVDRGPVAFFPRVYPYLPRLGPDQGK